MAVQLVALLFRGMWANSVWLLVIMAVTDAPALLAPRLPEHIPAEFEFLAILFVFASFLGEFHSYYERFWWWDSVLHSTSGLLPGIVGFLLVYMLNENRHIDMHMRPGFAALFAFAFDGTVSAFGWWHMKRDRRSFIDGWTDRFTANDPRLFCPRRCAR